MAYESATFSKPKAHRRSGSTHSAIREARKAYQVNGEHPDREPLAQASDAVRKSAR